MSSQFWHSLCRRLIAWSFGRQRQHRHVQQQHHHDEQDEHDKYDHDDHRGGASARLVLREIGFYPKVKRLIVPFGRANEDRA